MTALSTWSAGALLGVVLGYAILVLSAFLLPTIVPAFGEIWRIRKSSRDWRVLLLLPYPSFLMHWRRSLLIMIGPPMLLVLAWLWARTP